LRIGFGFGGGLDMPSESFPEGRVLYQFTPTPADNITGFDDVAEEYVVTEHPDAMAGLVIHALYDGAWHTNPFSARHVVKRLLEDKTRLEKFAEILRTLLEAAVKAVTG
jgi:hypothetical protein